MSISITGKFKPAGAGGFALVDAVDADVDTAGFGGNLSSADTTVQAALSTLDQLKVDMDSNYIIVDGVEVEKKHAQLTASTAGNHLIKAGVTGKKLRIINLDGSAWDTVDAEIIDTDGNNLRGPWHLIEAAGMVLAEAIHGWATTPTGKGLMLKLSDDVQCSVSVDYIEV
jgi:hypothetical protein